MSSAVNVKSEINNVSFVINREGFLELKRLSVPLKRKRPSMSRADVDAMHIDNENSVKRVLLRTASDEVRGMDDILCVSIKSSSRLGKNVSAAGLKLQEGSENRSVFSFFDESEGKKDGWTFLSPEGLNVSFLADEKALALSYAYAKALAQKQNERVRKEASKYSAFVSPMAYASSYETNDAAAFAHAAALDRKGLLEKSLKDRSAFEAALEEVRSRGSVAKEFTDTLAYALGTRKMAEERKTDIRQLFPAGTASLSRFMNTMMIVSMNVHTFLEHAEKKRMEGAEKAMMVNSSLTGEGENVINVNRGNGGRSDDDEGEDFGSDAMSFSSDGKVQTQDEGGYYAISTQMKDFCADIDELFESLYGVPVPSGEKEAAAFEGTSSIKKKELSGIDIQLINRLVNETEVIKDELVKVLDEEAGENSIISALVTDGAFLSSLANVRKATRSAIMSEPYAVAVNAIDSLYGYSTVRQLRQLIEKRGGTDETRISAAALLKKAEEERSAGREPDEWSIRAWNHNLLAAFIRSSESNDRILEEKGQDMVRLADRLVKLGVNVPSYNSRGNASPLSSYDIQTIEDEFRQRELVLGLDDAYINALTDYMGSHSRAGAEFSDAYTFIQDVVGNPELFYKQRLDNMLSRADKDCTVFADQYKSAHGEEFDFKNGKYKIDAKGLPFDVLSLEYHVRRFLAEKRFLFDIQPVKRLVSDLGDSFPSNENEVLMNRQLQLYEKSSRENADEEKKQIDRILSTVRAEDVYKALPHETDFSSDAADAYVNSIAVLGRTLDDIALINEVDAHDLMGNRNSRERIISSIAVSGSRQEKRIADEYVKTGEKFFSPSLGCSDYSAAGKNAVRLYAGKEYLEAFLSACGKTAKENISERMSILKEKAEKALADSKNEWGLESLGEAESDRLLIDDFIGKYGSDEEKEILRAIDRRENQNDIEFLSAWVDIRESEKREKEKEGISISLSSRDIQNRKPALTISASIDRMRRKNELKKKDADESRLKRHEAKDSLHFFSDSFENGCAYKGETAEGTLYCRLIKEGENELLYGFVESGEDVRNIVEVYEKDSPKSNEMHERLDSYSPFPANDFRDILRSVSAKDSPFTFSMDESTAVPAHYNQARRAVEDFRFSESLIALHSANSFLVGDYVNSAVEKKEEKAAVQELVSRLLDKKRAISLFSAAKKDLLQNRRATVSEKEYKEKRAEDRKSWQDYSAEVKFKRILAGDSMEGDDALEKDSDKNVKKNILFGGLIDLKETVEAFREEYPELYPSLKELALWDNHVRIMNLEKDARDKGKDVQTLEKEITEAAKNKYREEIDRKYEPCLNDPVAHTALMSLLSLVHDVKEREGASAGLENITRTLSSALVETGAFAVTKAGVRAGRETLSSSVHSALERLASSMRKEESWDEKNKKKLERTGLLHTLASKLGEGLETGEFSVLNDDELKLVRILSSTHPALSVLCENGMEDIDEDKLRSAAQECTKIASAWMDERNVYLNGIRKNASYLLNSMEVSEGFSNASEKREFDSLMARAQDALREGNGLVLGSRERHFLHNASYKSEELMSLAAIDDRPLFDDEIRSLHDECRTGRDRAEAERRLEGPASSYIQVLKDIIRRCDESRNNISKPFTVTPSDEEVIRNIAGEGRWLKNPVDYRALHSMTKNVLEGGSMNERGELLSLVSKLVLDADRNGLRLDDVFHDIASNPADFLNEEKWKSLAERLKAVCEKEMENQTKYVYSYDLAKADDRKELEARRTAASLIRQLTSDKNEECDYRLLAYSALYLKGDGRFEGEEADRLYAWAEGNSDKPSRDEWRKILDALTDNGRLSDMLDNLDTALFVQKALDERGTLTAAKAEDYLIGEIRRNDSLAEIPFEDLDNSRLYRYTKSSDYLRPMTDIPLDGKALASYFKNSAAVAASFYDHSAAASAERRRFITYKEKLKDVSKRKLDEAEKIIPPMLSLIRAVETPSAARLFVNDKTKALSLDGEAISAVMNNVRAILDEGKKKEKEYEAVRLSAAVSRNLYGSFASIEARLNDLGSRNKALFRVTDREGEAASLISKLSEKKLSEQISWLKTLVSDDEKVMTSLSPDGVRYANVIKNQLLYSRLCEYISSTSEEKIKKDVCSDVRNMVRKDGKNVWSLERAVENLVYGQECVTSRFVSMLQGGKSKDGGKALEEAAGGTSLQKGKINELKKVLSSLEPEKAAGVLKALCDKDFNLGNSSSLLKVCMPDEAAAFHEYVSSPSSAFASARDEIMKRDIESLAMAIKRQGVSSFIDRYVKGRVSEKAFDVNNSEMRGSSDDIHRVFSQVCRGSLYKSLPSRSELLELNSNALEGKDMSIILHLPSSLDVRGLLAIMKEQYSKGKIKSDVRIPAGAFDLSSWDVRKLSGRGSRGGFYALTPLVSVSGRNISRTDMVNMISRLRDESLLKLDVSDERDRKAAALLSSVTVRVSEGDEKKKDVSRKASDSLSRSSGWQLVHMNLPEGMSVEDFFSSLNEAQRGSIPETSREIILNPDNWIIEKDGASCTLMPRGCVSERNAAIMHEIFSKGSVRLANGENVLTSVGFQRNDETSYVREKFEAAERAYRRNIQTRLTRAAQAVYDDISVNRVSVKGHTLTEISEAIDKAGLKKSTDTAEKKPENVKVIKKPSISRDGR